MTMSAASPAVLISSAYAQAAPAAGADAGLMSFLPLILMFVLLYFLMIRPQMKRAKEQKAMVDGLAKGDEVITAGGVLAACGDDGDAPSASASEPKPAAKAKTTTTKPTEPPLYALMATPLPRTFLPSRCPFRALRSSHLKI